MDFPVNGERFDQVQDDYLFGGELFDCRALMTTYKYRIPREVLQLPFDDQYRDVDGPEQGRSDTAQ